MPGTLQVDAGGRIDLSRFSSFPAPDTSQLVILQEGTVDSYNTTAEMLRLTDGQILNYTNAGGSREEFSQRLLVRPVGPRIRIRNSIYRINGIPVHDTIVYEPNSVLFAETLLTATNTGSDISSQTMVRIYPGEFYEVLTDSLDPNCSFSNGILSVDFEDIIPAK